MFLHECFEDFVCIFGFHLCLFGYVCFGFTDFWFSGFDPCLPHLTMNLVFSLNNKLNLKNNKIILCEHKGSENIYYALHFIPVSDF